MPPSDTTGQRRTEPWPADAPCWRCGQEVGLPVGKLIPRWPTCPVCIVDLIHAALDDDGSRDREDP